MFIFAPSFVVEKINMAGPLVSILLPGDPRGKGRPRFRVIRPKGGGAPFASVYTDAETAAYEAALAKEGNACWAGRAPLDGALTCFVEAFMPIPASWSNKKRAAASVGSIFPVGKPDGDNIQKCVGDALNKIIWVDDSQIIMWQCLKLYSDFPRLRVSVWLWDDVPDTEPELL